MGISAMEDNRQHIKRVENALSSSLQESGYKCTWLVSASTIGAVARL